MDRCKAIHGRVLRFLKREDGNITVFSVLMVLLTLMISGAAVDIMRFESTRAQMQTQMDRAVLAAADLDQYMSSDAVVRDYMDKAGMKHVLLGTQIDWGFNHRTVKAWGETTIPTFFLRMSGYDSLTPPALSVAEEKIANVEISLVLDISGSMRWNERMVRLKPAAQNFVHKVMTDETNGVTTLNLVPFAGQVNPGDILFDYFRGERPDIPDPDPEPEPEPVVDDGDYFPPWGQAISNIVIYFDTDGDDIYNRAHKIEGFPEDAPRDVDAFYRGAVAYMIAHDSKLSDPGQFLGISIKGGWQRTRYFQVKGDQNGPHSDLGPTSNRGRIPGRTYRYGEIDFAAWADSYVSPNLGDLAAGGDTTDESADDPIHINMPSSCVEIYDPEFDTTELPLSDDYVPHFHHWEIDEEAMDWGWCPGEQMAVQYYSADRDALLQFIGDMRMHDGTGTQYGMKYGLALLDPANRDEVSHLIANGLVDARFEGRPIDWHDPETEKYIVLMTDGQTTDQFRPNDPRDPINGEVELLQQGATSYYNMSLQSKNKSNLQKQCDLARQHGVTVFTIAFETDDAAAAEMLACASSASHFFHVQGAEIYETFDTIARQINNLRLIQ